MSSFGPVNFKRPKFGECVYCWDENWTRDTGFYFESRLHMIGPVCKHRLHKPKRWMKQHKLNAYHEEHREWAKGAETFIGHPDAPEIVTRPGRERTESEEYWYRRSMLPDYCGEPGELVPGPVNDFVFGTK